jgi:hypothetical protein
MTQTCTSTQNEILRYVYNETSSSENVFIENSIAKSNELLDYYLDCLEIKKNLSSVVLYPKDSTLNNILEYSKNFRPTIYS